MKLRLLLLPLLLVSGLGLSACGGPIINTNSHSYKTGYNQGVSFYHLGDGTDFHGTATGNCTYGNDDFMAGCIQGFKDQR